MEETGGQIVTPVVSYHSVVGRLCDSNPTVSKKRDHHFDSSNPAPQKAAETWNANDWIWDSARFIAKPSLQCSEATEKTNRGVSDTKRTQNPAREGGESRNPEEDAALGSGEAVPKRVKRLKPVSPVHLACQVDDCTEDLSVGKDYHKRHRVCEIHSKASEALVGKQPQRFCQQCSRFHPLEEFDEGKRSCRRRLDGHNRRRRKGHPEVIPQSYGQNSGDSNIVNLLVALSRVQKNSRDDNRSPPDNNRLFEIISNANPSFPGTKLQDGSVPGHLLTVDDQMPIYQNVPPNQPTKDLLAVLSTAPGTPSSGALEMQSPRGSTEESHSEKSKSSSGNVATCLNLNGGGQQMKEFPLKLSGISSENRMSKGSPTYWNFGSYCSNIPLERKVPSPSKPPVTRDFFAMQSSREKSKDDGGDQGTAPQNDKVNSSNLCSTSLRLFASETASFLRSSPEQIEQASTSGSNHSLSSLNSDSQDRTGRIMFKLFDKDPSHLPVSLRTQISNWLLHSPSDMESYIRPGCMVLTIYISMPAFSWDHLEENLLSYVKSLVVDIDVGFWGSDRFLLHTDRQMASFSEGKLRLCRNWMAPELVSISPLAVVRGRETSLVLKGKRLLSPDAKIHCARAVGYSVMKSPASCDDSALDEIILSSFKVDDASFGRCYVEVECGLKSACFPVIVADEAICNELRLLELHIETGFEVGDESIREWILHFLNELGWLFQRRRDRFSSAIRSYNSLGRLKFLLVFSVDHGFCALAETLLDIITQELLGLCGEGGGSSAVDVLSESRLLDRAVKRRCRSMVTMLVRYSVVDRGDGSERFLFAADVAGPGGLTPLHLVASMSDAGDVVDALTSDPLEVGLSSWSSLLDANGFSPYAYAAMNGNHSYNSLVDRKISERKGDDEGRVSISIGDDDSEQQRGDSKKSSCSSGCGMNGSVFFRSLFHRPLVVAVATVCFCVCVVMRGHPGGVRRDGSPFLWENLNFGST